MHWAGAEQNIREEHMVTTIFGFSFGPLWVRDVCKLAWEGNNVPYVFRYQKTSWIPYNVDD